MKKIGSILLGLVLLGTVLAVIIWIIYKIWAQFKLLDPAVSTALLTAAATVLVATITVVLGKYYERKKDIEAHYRTKKTEIYDAFLVELFKMFYFESHVNKGKKSPNQTEQLVKFLREWQRKMILWGGQDVLRKYILWMSHLKKNVPDVEAMFLMEDFFFEIRKDLGHKNSKLIKGTFISLVLKDPELFLQKAKENPNLTLDELTKIEAGNPD